MNRGRFIVFEGGEGTGKSTQAERLAARLDALLTREPGGTQLGAQLRSLVLSAATDADASGGPGSGSGSGGSGSGLSDRAEALLMAADRAQHVDELIEPTLIAGRDVVCDRFIGSSVAYQGYGRGLDVDIVRAVSGWASGGLWPDLVVLLSVPRDEAVRRTGGARDRIEAAGAEFHERVAQGFLDQADDDPDTWVVVDGTGTPDEVEDRVLDAVAEVLGFEA